MKEKVEADYNASQVSAVTQGLDGNPVTLIQVRMSVDSMDTILLAMADMST